jgi:uncharacterized membrane protein YkvA (DUF1232 family)
MDERHSVEKYQRHYSEESFWAKLGKSAKRVGLAAVEQALRLFYVIKAPGAPKWAKGVAVGALGYLILPIDLIPDFIPVIGFTDDAAAIAAALVTLEVYVTQEIKDAAKRKLGEWFG